MELGALIDSPRFSRLSSTGWKIALAAVNSPCTGLATVSGPRRLRCRDPDNHATDRRPGHIALTAAHFAVFGYASPWMPLLTAEAGLSIGATVYSYNVHVASKHPSLCGLAIGSWAG